MKSIRRMVTIAIVIAIWSTVNVQAAENDVAIASPEEGRTYDANRNIEVHFKVWCEIEKPSKVNFHMKGDESGARDINTVWFFQYLEIHYDERLEDDRYRFVVEATCGDDTRISKEVEFKVIR